jgi:serine/threonine protein kinase
VPAPAVGLICPACQTSLPHLVAGTASLLCPGCHLEVDAARLETLVGKPRFVAERSWAGAEIDGMVVEEMIGAGGMGTVYRACSARPGEPALAVKFLSPSLAAEPELVSRFRREVALLEELDHPGIVKVRSHGESQGVPWFAMQLVDGPTLALRLGKGPLGVDEARGIFLRLLEALDHAHGRGVVHRDLKPANVLLAADGARLADFGIAHLDLDTVSRKTQLTRTSAILGTFPYMSPEQRAGRAVDARSDLYSIGVMLYEALAGERPEGAFAPLHRRRSDVPAQVDQVVLRLLQPDPALRLASASAARAALSRALRPGQVGRRRLAWAGTGFLTLLLAAGSSVWFGKGAPPPAPPISKQLPKENPAPPPLPQTQQQAVEPRLPQQAEMPEPQAKNAPGKAKAPLALRKLKVAPVAKYTRTKSGKSFSAKDSPNPQPKQQATNQSPAPSQMPAPLPGQPETQSIGRGFFGKGGKMGRKTKAANDDDLFGTTKGE